MRNGKLTGDIIERLGDYILKSVGDRAINGVTYALFLDSSNEDRKKVETYTRLKEDIDACGVDSDSILQKVRVNNGYIFNLDIDVARKVLGVISKKVTEWSNGEVVISNDLLRDRPTKRRKEDIEALCKHLIKEGNSGRKTCEVALYSRNSSRKIMCMAKGPKGVAVKPGEEYKMIELKAYAIRHRDISSLTELLLQQGYKITTARIGEILPSKTGVRFLVGIDRL